MVERGPYWESSVLKSGAHVVANATLVKVNEDKIPFFDGDYLAMVTRKQLAEVFSGSIEMPMLDERVEILNKVGKTLSEKYAGRYANFIRDCDPKLYSNGNGLLERLIREFPRFDDVSIYKGQRAWKTYHATHWPHHLTETIMY